MNKDTLRSLIRERVFIRGTKLSPVALRGSNVYRDLPWIFDFRAITLEAPVLTYLAETFWETYAHKYPFQVGGMESASIPLITAIVLKGQERNTPIHGFFIRKSRKRDGLMKMFEGGLTEDPVILVDDIINSGKSIYKQVLELSEAGRTVTDIFTIISFRTHDSYGFAHRRSITITSLFSLIDFGKRLLGGTPGDVPKESFATEWRFAAGKPRFNFVVEKSAPCIDQKSIYFGSDDSTMWSLDKITGAVRWRFKTGPHPKGIFSSPALLDHRLYFGAYDGNVYALDTATGSPQWVYRDADWVGSSPALSSKLGLLFIGLEFSLPGKQGGIAALSLSTGKLIWCDRTSEFTHGSPLYIEEEDMIVIGSNDGVAYAYRASNGQRLWTYRTGGEIKGSFAYDSLRRVAVCGSWDGTIYTLRVSDGSLAYSYKTDEAIFSTPCIRDGVAYIGSLDKNVYAINLDTGALLWSFPTNGRIFASPVIAEDSLWIGSNDGRLYEIDPASGTLRGFFQVTERIVNAIAYDDSSHSLYVPTVANEMYCIRRA